MQNEAKASFSAFTGFGLSATQRARAILRCVSNGFSAFTGFGLSATTWCRKWIFFEVEESFSAFTGFGLSATKVYVLVNTTGRQGEVSVPSQALASLLPSSNSRQRYWKASFYRRFSAFTGFGLSATQKEFAAQLAAEWFQCLHRLWPLCYLLSRADFPFSFGERFSAFTGFGLSATRDWK